MERGLVYVSLMLLIFHNSCTRKEEIEFSVTSPLQKDTLLTRDYVCQIHSIQHIELRAREKGYLQSIFIEEGKPVRQGQTMFQILPLNPKAELQNAEEAVKLAAIEYRYIKQLVDSNFMSGNDLALAKTKFNKAKEQIALAQAHTRFIEIKAPFDGIADRIEVQLGSLVDGGTLLTTLSDGSKMWVDFNVPKGEYTNLRMNQKKSDPMKVNLLVAHNMPFNHVGIVQAVEEDFDSVNLVIRAAFPNPKGLLWDGETGHVQMAAELRRALIIPRKTTFKVRGKKYVFVVTKDNLIQQREIVVGAELSDLCIVNSGLSENEKIVLNGIREVNDKDKVEKYEYLDPKILFHHPKVNVGYGSL